MSGYPLVWVITGVAGSGKTVVGRLLSERLESDFLEGDRRHPSSNIAKMLSGQPLQDQDRQEWLQAIEDDIRQAICHRRETVITCSALKASYRSHFTALGAVQLVWLNVPETELKRRLSNRLNHYMSHEMLESQIACFETITLEEQVIAANGSLLPNEVVSAIIEQAIQIFPNLSKPWWQRCIDGDLRT